MNNTVNRFIEILEYISQAPQGASIANVSHDLGISKTSVFDMIHTAVGKGLLVAGDSRQMTFRLGSKAIEIFGSYMNSNGYWPMIHGSLTALSKSTGRSIFFFQCEQIDMILMDAIHLGVSYSPQINIGSRIKCWNSKVGYVYLAALGEAELDTVMRSADLSNKEQAAILQNIDDVRNRGYLVSDINVADVMITCISVPVFNAQSACEGAITIYDLVNRLPRENITQIVSVMMETALAISMNLGYQERELITAYRRLDAQPPSK